MNKDPIVFALSNPIPEIIEEERWKVNIKIFATG